MQEKLTTLNRNYFVDSFKEATSKVAFCNKYIFFDASQTNSNLQNTIVNFL